MSIWNLLAKSQSAPSKAQVDRALYSKQNRERLLKSAGIDTDPLAQSFEDYQQSRYDGVRKSSFSPKVPLWGYMAAQRVGVDPTLPAKKMRNEELYPLLRRLQPGDHEIEVDRSFHDPNIAGYTTDKRSPSITLVPGDDTKLADLLSTYSHEVEHINDLKKEYNTEPAYISPRGRRLNKWLHHGEYTDYETDAPLAELVKAAAISGEPVRADLVGAPFEYWEDKWRRHSQPQIQDALNRRERGLGVLDKLKILFRTGTINGHD